MTPETIRLPFEKGFDGFLDHSGILIKHQSENHSLFINATKGGILNLFDKKGIREVDFGWRLKLEIKKVAVSHWLDQDYKTDLSTNDVLTIKGNMSSHGWMKTTPFRHMVLRVLSFLFGNRLIPALKKAMILGKSSLDVKFVRTIALENGRIKITDRFSGPALRNRQLYRAPHYSLRHVSSAGQFVPEEMIEIDQRKYETSGSDKLDISREISF